MLNFGLNSLLKFVVLVRTLEPSARCEEALGNIVELHGDFGFSVVVLTLPLLFLEKI